MTSPFSSDFDPLAALEAAVAAPPCASAPPAPAFEIPLDLGRLAPPLGPDESPAARLAAAMLLPAAVGPRDGSDPRKAPAPPPPPYPFDLTSPAHVADVALLCVLPASKSDESAAARAAARLLAAHENRYSTSLSLPDAVNRWWKAVVRVADVPALLCRPGQRRNALRQYAVRLAAEAFARAMQLPPSAWPSAFEGAGVHAPNLAKLAAPRSSVERAPVSFFDTL